MPCISRTITDCHVLTCSVNMPLCRHKLMLDWLLSQKPQRHKCTSSCDLANSLDFMLFDYWLVSAQRLMESHHGALLGADAKALLSRLKSDAYPAELTGAVSVNFLFIEKASSQRLRGNVT